MYAIYYESLIEAVLVSPLSQNLEMLACVARAVGPKFVNDELSYLKMMSSFKYFLIEIKGY